MSILFALRRWDRGVESFKSQTLKIIGRADLSPEEIDKKLGSFDPRNVKTVSIERCHLQMVPHSLLHFDHLSSLNLRGNKLRDIEPLCKFVSLRSLNLASNMISHLPVSIVALRKLRCINLSDNPLPLPVFLDATKSLSETQNVLKFARDFFSRAPRCRSAIMTLMAVKRFGNSPLFAFVPRDVVLIIARLLYDTRHDEDWNCTKLSTFFFPNQ